MAVIIPIAEARRSVRPAGMSGKVMGPAKVVLFTGVRYEKRDTEPAGKDARKRKPAPETAFKS
ncbi:MULTISPECIES: hypothetical protein [Agrobacterium]|uniref:Uncharacterized protein n=1 Tax=Agrobacterium tumefaciens TaxID=358 RepID=A0AAJ4N264_AGRTU|nr:MULTISPECIES: hypothetical protein [Agrobacterium]MEA1842017.1 hypothetical protein [Agrobacterium tumefaciens]MRH96456.1 hypothetical protein [Agrobacterium tumefaciens]NTA41509.1 hypothetical protein [Agrobacterium tumefaciens]NTA57793.1 hypothetical protein [Agrobacterium tumefaciens]QTG13571.1 hypothetical protein G6M86_10070 [Agrobacterium tumefaciens]